MTICQKLANAFLLLKARIQIVSSVNVYRYSMVETARMSFLGYKRSKWRWKRQECPGLRSWQTSPHLSEAMQTLGSMDFLSDIAQMDPHHHMMRLKRRLFRSPNIARYGMITCELNYNPSSSAPKDFVTLMITYLGSDLSNCKYTRWHSRIAFTSLQNLFQIIWRFISAIKSLIIWKIYTKQQDNELLGESINIVIICQARPLHIRDRNLIQSQSFARTSDRSSIQRSQTARTIWN